MAMKRVGINPVQDTKVVGKRGSPGSAGIGQKAGALLGGVIGGVTGGPGGAIAGAQTGAGLGGMIGGMVDPGRADTRQVEVNNLPQMPTYELSRASQSMLDAIRSIDKFPEAADRHLNNLTNAYIKSQMELKRRS